MKNYILPFIFGIFITVSINAAIDSREIIVKPATPKMVSSVDMNWSDDRSAHILKMTKQGYILKSCTAAGSNSIWTIVMEKY